MLVLCSFAFLARKQDSAVRNFSAQIARGRFWLLLPEMSKNREVFSGQSGTVFLDGRRETPPANEMSRPETSGCARVRKPLINEQKENGHA